MSDHNPPAFPVPERPASRQALACGEKQRTAPASANGMTLRDYFAAKAMQVVAQDDSWRDNQYVPQDGLSCMENNARLAYQIADAMLAERAK